MKKFSKLFCVIIMAILLVVPSASVFAAKTTKKTTTTTTTSATYAVSEDEKAVTMHVFYSPTCGHCAALHEFLSELKEDKDYKDKFNIKDYNVSDSLNIELLDEVRDHFKNAGDGVPYYVIGDVDFEGFGESSKAEIKKTIDDMYGSKNYKDVVNAIVKDEVGTLSDDANNVIGMVVLGLCVVIIIVLIICSSKNKYYEDDLEDEEETESEEKEEEKVSEKKSESKTNTSSSKKNSKNANSKKKK